MLAAYYGHTETVKALIEAGADVTLQLESVYYIQSHFLLCTNLDPQQSEETALMLAAQGRHTETVKALIEAGTDVNPRNKIRLQNFFFI